MAFSKNRLYSLGGNAKNTINAYLYYNSASDDVTATGYFNWDVLVAGDQIVVVNADYSKRTDYSVSSVASGAATVTLVSGGILDIDADATTLALTQDVVTFDTTTEAISLALPDGSAGQRLTMIMIVDGGNDVVVTPAHFANGTTLTFADVLDTVELIFVNDAWYVTSLEGVAVA